MYKTLGPSRNKIFSCDYIFTKNPHPDSIGNEAKEIASIILRFKVLVLTKYVHKFSEDTFCNRGSLERMRCDMHDVSFYLNVASEYLMRFGESDPEES